MAPSTIKFTNNIDNSNNNSNDKNLSVKDNNNNNNGNNINNNTDSSDQSLLLKQLNIKKNVIRRYFKELESYERELTRQLEYIENMECDSNNCQFTIRKQYEVLEETRKIIPDCRQRLENAKADLQIFLERHPELVNCQGS